MPMPVFVGQNSSNTGTAGSTGAVGAPANLAIGDFMVLVVGFGAGASITTLSGWTLIGTTVATTNTKSSMFIKVAVSGDIGATFTWTFTGTTTTSVFCVVAYRNIFGTTVDSTAEASSTTAQNVTTPTTTAVSKCNMVLYTRTCRDDTSTGSNAQCTSSATGSNLRSTDVLTVAAPAAHSAQIWDTLGSGVVSLVAAGSVTGISTSSGTTTPTEGVARTITLQCSQPDPINNPDTFGTSQSNRRASRW